MLVWDESLELGIDLIDNQHRAIFEQINLLIKSFDEDTQQDRAYEVLCFVEEYVNKHFSTEEFFLEKHKYNDYDSHIQMHRAFSKQLTEYKINHRKSGITKLAAIEMHDFLNSWWNNHIIKIDSRYVGDIGAHIH